MKDILQQKPYIDENGIFINPYPYIRPTYDGTEEEIDYFSI
jgi:hypothetical protein